MSNEYIVDKKEMDCPICGRVHKLEKRKRETQGIVKGIVVNYEEIFYLCPITTDKDNEFVPAAMMDENLSRARDSYNLL